MAGRHRGRPNRSSSGGVKVLIVTGIDEDGDLTARLADDQDGGGAPIYITAPRGGHGHGRGKGRAHGGPALAPGDRVLARLRPAGRGRFEAEPIRRLPARPTRVLGMIEWNGAEGAQGARLRPTDKRTRGGFMIDAHDLAGAEHGELVLAQVLQWRRGGDSQARVVERLGPADSPRAASEIAQRAHDIPSEFSQAALDEAAAAKPVRTDGRTDLRGRALVTIDDETARDFDDAVWAAPDEAPDNQGGWQLLVGIADVAWYVRPGSALDDAARERGNSVYFPDRVIPMLPEALSNGLCSLKPHEDRGCIAAEIRIDAAGKIISHRFMRGVMRSAARLTYRQVQDAAEGRLDETTAPLSESLLPALYGAFHALAGARERRGTIDLDLPERAVTLGESGEIAAIGPRPRLDSHRLIEEFMIAANIAAAETLEQRGYPCVYRAHESPAPERVADLRESLAGLGLRLAKGQVLQSRHFADLVESVRGTPAETAVNFAVLRSQARAEYSLENPGHFALALRRYAHFTSPIRRYADLLVHRALIGACGLGTGGIKPSAGAAMEQAAGHISRTERRAAAAEREALDRLTARFLGGRIGETFAARISHIARFGMFITLKETGADGLIPGIWLEASRYRLNFQRQTLTPPGRGKALTLGDEVTVRLEEADLVTGALAFSLAGTRGPERAPTPGRRRRKGRNRGG